MPHNRIAQIAEIHIGENTHNQDHEITFVTFKTINKIVRNDTIPIPPFRAFFLFIYLHLRVKFQFIALIISWL